MKPVAVLFLCETNAAASLIAESYLNARGLGALRAFSAGRVPAAAMLDEARETLAARGLAHAGLGPKDVSIFTLPGAPPVDLVVDLVPEDGVASVVVPGVPRLRWPMAEVSRVPKPLRRQLCEALLDALAVRIECDLARFGTRRDSAGLVA
ncbi:arsenate-mycothiol transferase ArsC [Methylobrevis albus]|uniref:Protein-tyrosine-phosphatase n=1 Tax=Methylobrevis albus TaxID=2793297 RepID=A0A931N013_9HYPH|nr:hypothetical protein [Methylobrevis albus]MBH0238689.1 hypothetical protein [Methylobrevis albus]